MQPGQRSAAFLDAADFASQEQRAVALIQQGRLHEGEAIYRNLIAAGTDNHVTYGNLAAICGMTGRIHEARELLQKVLDLNPDYPEAHNNLGNTLQDQGELKEAVACYRRALSLRESYPEAHFNLGNALHRLSDLAAAIDHYRRALAIRPDYADAKAHLSMALLLSGDYERGWREYECRLEMETADRSLTAQPPCARWDGDPLHADTPLLLVCEQGLGDTLQFMRYGLHLRRQGVEAHLCAPTRLHRLIEISGIDPAPLTPEQGNVFRDGAWLPLLSLPGRLGVHPGHPIVTEPYIATSPERIHHWRRRFAAERRPLIGLHWQGNPANETTNSRGRSLPLETFAPIARDLEGSLVSLQKGFGSEQLERCSFRDRFVRCQPEVDQAWDFLDTAAIVANCDLILTSDSALAHLAGGMGQPTWLLLKSVPEWRWGLEGEASFWYPSLRLFRQRRRDDWGEVLRRVAAALHRQPPDGGSAPAVLAPISLGELVDRITRLEIEAERPEGPRPAGLEGQLEELRATLAALPHTVSPAWLGELREINAALARLEQQLREAARTEGSGESCIALARAVQRQRDRRAAIREAITRAWGEASA